MRSMRDLAWLAGLIEGEGCYSIRGDTGFIITVAMADEDIIRRCQEIAGVGRVYGPYAVKGENLRTEREAPWRPRFMWTVAAQQDAAALAMTMYPFHGERRRAQIEQCLAVWRARPVYRGAYPARQWYDDQLPIMQRLPL